MADKMDRKLRVATGELTVWGGSVQQREPPDVRYTRGVFEEDASTFRVLQIIGVLRIHQETGREWQNARLSERHTD